MSAVEHFAVNHPLVLLALNVFGDQMGLPIPSYPSLVLAGAFASQQGSPHPALIILMVLWVCLLADGAWYLMGARFGDALTRRLSQGSPSMMAAIAQARDAYLRYGPVVLVFARFLPGAGAVSTLLAGQMAMPRSHFVAYSLLGSLLWSSSALALGAGFGGPILYLFDSLKLYLLVALAGIGLGTFVLVLVRLAGAAPKPALGHPTTRHHA